MGSGPDPDAIRQLAGQARSVAEEIRTTAFTHVSNGYNLEWESTSASAFRDGLIGDRQRAWASADDLDETADRMDELANTVENRLAALAAAAAAAAALAEETAQRIEDGIEWVSDAASNVADGVSDVTSGVSDVAGAAWDTLTERFR